VWPEAASFGAIMAGGRNTRYGSAKALERVSGSRIIDRVIAALQTATRDLILIANDQAAYASVDLPKRGDERPDLGALGGIHAALRWANEERRNGILAVACDMPFISGPLLVKILETAKHTGADVVAPESNSRRGLEPLCAFYSTRCLDAINDAIARADYRMIGFHDQVQVHALPLEEVRSFGEPDVLFMNVNTVAERDRAELIAQSLEA
jgi:molybdopterin-guanine dinucleotide biosynthesis protein A